MGGHDNKTSRNLANKLSKHRQRGSWFKGRKRKSSKRRNKEARREKKAAFKKLTPRQKEEYKKKKIIKDKIEKINTKEADKLGEKGVAYTQAFKTRQSFGAASKGRSLSEEEVKKYIASLEEK